MGIDCSECQATSCEYRDDAKKTLEKYDVIKKEDELGKMIREREAELAKTAEKNVIFRLSVLIAGGATYKEAVEKTINEYLAKWGESDETLD